MRTTVISSQGNPAIVTFQANVANVSSTIFKAKVPRGALYVLSNENKVKDVQLRGAYFILDLNKADGTRISGASKVHVLFKGPADERATPLRALPYSIWRDISSTQQRNEDYKATLVGQSDLGPKVHPGLKLPEEYEFILELESPDLIDPSKSYVQVEFLEFN